MELLRSFDLEYVTLSDGDRLIVEALEPYVPADIYNPIRAEFEAWRAAAPDYREAAYSVIADLEANTFPSIYAFAHKGTYYIIRED